MRDTTRIFIECFYCITSSTKSFHSSTLIIAAATSREDLVTSTKIDSSTHIAEENAFTTHLDGN